MAALEAGGHRPAGLGSLGAATRRLALAPLTAADPGPGNVRTGSRAQMVDFKAPPARPSPARGVIAFCHVSRPPRRLPGGGPPGPCPGSPPPPPSRPPPL